MWEERWAVSNQGSYFSVQHEQLERDKEKERKSGGAEWVEGKALRGNGE